MLILLGPDGTGKTTLALQLKSKFGMEYKHYTQHHYYNDYISDLVSLKLRNCVLDRYAFCDVPYSKVMQRAFLFTPKQFHNLTSMMLIQNPAIILCTHKPLEEDYPADQYLPYAKWDRCMELYIEFLESNHIPYITYDYADPIDLAPYISSHKTPLWWTKNWIHGYGCSGSPHPKVLMVAEELGPDNKNNIPFETGPTGYMMIELLNDTSTPLYDLALTNFIKAPYNVRRKPNDEDLLLLDEELEQLQPKLVVFMGKVSRAGIKVVESRGIAHEEITHLGYFNHARMPIPQEYKNQWKSFFYGITKLRLD